MCTQTIFTCAIFTTTATAAATVTTFYCYYWQGHYHHSNFLLISSRIKCMGILLLWDRSVTHNPKLIRFLFAVVALYRKIENSFFRTWFVFVTLTLCRLEPGVTLSDDTGMTGKFCFVRNEWLIIWHYSLSNFMQNWREKNLRRQRSHAARQQILAQISNIECRESRFIEISSCFKEKQTCAKILYVTSHMQLALTTLP